MKHIKLILLLVGCLLATSLLAAGDKKDLQQLADRYTEVASKDNTQQVFAALNAYLCEAARQKNVEHESQARTYRLYTYYNHGMKDSLYQYLPDDLKFFASHKIWTFYYSCWSLKVEGLLRDNKVQTALHESKQMYEEAKGSRQDNGQGISSYLIALCYQCMNRDKEAITFFTEAEGLLKKEYNVGQMHNLYAMTWQSLAVEGRYDEQLAMNDRWEEMWDTYCKTNKVKPDQLATYYIVCHLSRAHAYREKGDMEKAHVYLEKARVCVEGLHEISHVLYLQELALYEKQCGNYQRALDLANQRYRKQESLNNKMGCINALELRAELLAELKRPEEAVGLYKQLLASKDSLTRLDMAAQLDELRSIYDVDKFILKKQIAENKMYIAVSLALLLLVGILLYIRYTHQLKQKNKILYDKLKQLEIAEEAVSHAQSLKPAAELNEDEILYRKMCELLHSEKLFTSQIGRKELAERLHTNTTYIVEVIKQFADGMTVSGFINSYRLRYAGKLLAERPDLSVDAIAEEAGFTSRSTYYRQFRDYYGMSPNEYRSISRKNNP